MSNQKETLHTKLIDQLIDGIPGVRQHGFWRAHSELCQHLDIEEMRFGFVPDAWRINKNSSEIEIFEVEVHSKLKAHKIRILGEFWEFWDGECSDWLPVLILVDRFGNQSRMDLQSAVFGTGWAANLA